MHITKLITLIILIILGYNTDNVRKGWNIVILLSNFFFLFFCFELICTHVSESNRNSGQNGEIMLNFSELMTILFTTLHRGLQV